MSLTDETAKYKAILVLDATTMSPLLRNKALNNSLPKQQPLKQPFDPLLGIITFGYYLQSVVCLGNTQLWVEKSYFKWTPKNTLINF